MRMRPVEHRDLLQGDPLIPQLQDALRDKGRFLIHIVDRNHHRPRSLGPAGHERLVKLVGVLVDAGIREVEDLRGGAIVHLQSENLRPGIPLREFEDVIVVSAPPPIDRLGIVPDDHEVASVVRGHAFHDLRLDRVGVLILIDQEAAELPAEPRSRLRMVLQQRQPPPQQVVVIEGVGVPFLGRVAAQNPLDLLRPLDEVGSPALDDDSQRLLGIERETDEVLQKARGRKAFLLDRDPRLRHAHLEQIPLILFIQNRVVRRQAEELGVMPQDAVAEGMERPAPHLPDG